MYKTQSLIWTRTNWNSDWERNGPSWNAGSCRHCDSHLSVASSIAPDQWCMFYLQYFSHAVINWFKIWRIWGPQL